MAIIFDGKTFAFKREQILKKKVEELKKGGVVPHLASILVGNDPASVAYVNLKKKAAERIGIVLDIFDSVEKIAELNNDPKYQGVMVQLPLPKDLREKTDEILSSIEKSKDVDGLRSDSPFLHPTSKAAIQILKEAERVLGKTPKTVCVVGATGMVGTPLVGELKRLGYEVFECTSETHNLKGKTLASDAIVSATGKEGLIAKDMVKNDAIVIDVGYPKGDVVFDEVKEEASFITPVPGGVGPATVICLLENLISALE